VIKVPALYRVTGITKRVQIMPDGKFVEVYEVTFVTASGVSSSIVIPVDRFTREYAEQKIREEAEVLESVMTLGSE
jgi:hypothetical protein